MRTFLTSSLGNANLTEPVVGTVVALHISLLVRSGFLQLHPDFPQVVREGRNTDNENRVDTALVPRAFGMCLLFEYKRVPCSSPTTAMVKANCKLSEGLKQILERGYAARYLAKGVAVLPVGAVYKEDGSFGGASVGDIVRPHN